MCIAIVQPKGVVLPEESIRNGWIGNPDGGGFAFVKDGKVEIRKGFNKLRQFNDAYSQAYEENKDSPFLVHFRIRSMGDKGENNTHPFRFKHGAMIHNGTLSGTGANYQSGKTDTELFLAKYGDELTFDVVSKYRDDLGKAIDFNKLAFLYSNGEYAIVNEKDGCWHEGVWYSNQSFKSVSGSHWYQGGSCDV